MADPKAIFVQEGDFLDYTPAAAVASGDVVQLGALIGIAKNPIAASALGAVAVVGVFSFLKSGSTGPVFAFGDPVHWDPVNLLAKRGGDGYWYLGTCSEAAATGDTRVKVRLAPFALPACMQGKIFEDVSLAGGSKTLDIEDVGKVIVITAGHATNVVTLPATAAGQEFVVMAGVAGGRVALSPAAADKIFGPDIAGVDNKDRILTAATGLVGDYCCLEADAVNGFAIRAQRGIWTNEP